jgi:integrase
MKRRLTALSVERIKPPANGRLDVFDIGYPGLALRASYGGSKTWCAFVRAGGRQRRIKLGEWPGMTLAEAREAWRGVTNGTLPASGTVADVAAEWVKRDQAGNRTVAEVKRYFDRDVLPLWGHRKLSDLTRHECLKIIDAVADRGSPIAANRLHGYLHRFFKWCVGRDLIEVNPLAGIDKPGEAKSRERVLTDAELKAVWTTADQTGWPIGTIVQLLILTGARRGEIAELRWDEIHGNEIHLSGERTKNGRAHIIPLTPTVLDLLAKAPRLLDCPFVFSLNGKGPVNSWSKDKARLNERCQVKDWTLHDLRRTLATGLERLGVSLQVVEAILGHTAGSKRGVVGIYQRHDYAKEKRDALEQWSQYLLTLCRSC